MDGTYRDATTDWTRNPDGTWTPRLRGGGGGGGSQGGVGPSWNMLGEVDSVDDLPTDGSNGDSFLVTGPDPDEIWVLGDNGWVFAGNAGVEGPMGPAGPRGPAGDPGATGPPGAQGVPGPVGEVEEWLYGTTVPVNTLGKDGDWYLRSTGQSYEKVDGEWAARANLKGPTGAAGATGAQGLPGETGPTGATGPQGPPGPDGPTGAASTVPGPAGPAGPEGPESIWSGPTAPNPAEYDLWFDTDEPIYTTMKGEFPTPKVSALTWTATTASGATAVPAGANLRTSKAVKDGRDCLRIQHNGFTAAASTYKVNFDAMVRVSQAVVDQFDAALSFERAAEVFIAAGQYVYSGTYRYPYVYAGSWGPTYYNGTDPEWGPDGGSVLWRDSGNVVGSWYKRESAYVTTWWPDSWSGTDRMRVEVTFASTAGAVPALDMYVPLPVSSSLESVLTGGVLKWWDGQSWQTVGVEGPTGPTGPQGPPGPEGPQGPESIWSGPTAPDPATYDLWFDTDETLHTAAYATVPLPKASALTWTASVVPGETAVPAGANLRTSKVTKDGRDCLRIQHNGYTAAASAYAMNFDAPFSSSQEVDDMYAQASTLKTEAEVFVAAGRLAYAGGWMPWLFAGSWGPTIATTGEYGCDGTTLLFTSTPNAQGTWYSQERAHIQDDSLGWDKTDRMRVQVYFSAAAGAVPALDMYVPLPVTSVLTDLVTTGVLKWWDIGSSQWLPVGAEGPTGPPGPEGPEGPQGPAGAVSYAVACRFTATAVLNGTKVLPLAALENEGFGVTGTSVTVPVDGLYMVAVHVEINNPLAVSNTDQRFVLYAKVNGTTVLEDRGQIMNAGSTSALWSFTGQVAGVIRCVAGDAISVDFYSSLDVAPGMTVGDKGGERGNRLSVFKIG
jgi:hypothetical protein